jgi:hypothetical protein
VLEYERLDDAPLKAEIDRLTAGYPDKPGFFVDKLAQGVGMIAAAFYPKYTIIGSRRSAIRQVGNAVPSANGSCWGRLLDPARTDRRSAWGCGQRALPRG